MKKTKIMKWILFTATMVYFTTSVSQAQDVKRKTANRTDRIVIQDRQIKKLSTRLAASENEVAALRDRLSAIEAKLKAATAKPKATNDRLGKAQRVNQPAFALKVKSVSDYTFRNLVLKSIESELAKMESRFKTIEEQLANKVAKEEYFSHMHTYESFGRAFGTMAVVKQCPDCLIPYVPQSKVGKPLYLTTSTPKPKQ